MSQGSHKYRKKPVIIRPVDLALYVVFAYLLVMILQRSESYYEPYLIVCGFVAMAAIQSIFAGLVLKNIYQKNRQDFEMELYRVTSEFNFKK